MRARGLVLSETGDHPCTVVRCEDGLLTVRLDAFVQLGANIRLSFEQLAGTVRVLARWMGMDRDDLGMELRCQLVALHATAGRDALEEFLEDVAGVEQPSDAQFKEGAGGLYYRFQAPEAPEERPDPSYKRTTTSDVQSERREARIAVRVEVSYRTDTEEATARAYNVSSSGLYLLTESDLPTMGSDVEVSYPIPLHDRPLMATLYGEIVWIMDSMSAGTGGGLGIKISRIDDGANGGAWREYVARESSFGDSIALADNA